MLRLPVFRLWWQTAFALVLALAAPRWSQATELHVHNQDDFSIHIQAHKNRVIEGGRRLKELYPKLFGDVPDDLLVRYLEIHDVTKLRTPGADPLRVQRALYGNWRVNIGALPEAQKAAALAMIKELNDLDAKAAHEFFKRNGLLRSDGTLSELGGKLQRLEKIADQVDRGLDPIASEEFNRKLSPASTFIKDAEDRNLALALERNYSDILERESFVATKKRMRCAEKLGRVH